MWWFPTISSVKSWFIIQLISNHYIWLALGFQGIIIRRDSPHFRGNLTIPVQTPVFFFKINQAPKCSFFQLLLLQRKSLLWIFFWRKKTSLKQPFPCNPCNHSCTTWGLYKPQTNITELLWFSNSGSCHPRFLAEPFWVPLLMLLPTKRPSLRSLKWLGTRTEAASTKALAHKK